MVQKYRVPFNLDLEDLISEDKGLTEAALLELIEKDGDNHNVVVDTEDMHVTGDIESLSSFFMMLEGPGPAFNMEEFEEWVLEEGVNRRLK